MKSYSITDVGKRRSSNQDFCFCSERPLGDLPNLFIVADGMGGYAAGDLASKLAVEAIVESISTKHEKDIGKALQNAIKYANTEIRKKASTDTMLEGMGTTCVCAVIEGKTLHIANVGDSRLYVKGEEISQVTTDHSYVQEMVRMGRIKASEASKHPNKNIITRALGAEDGVEPDVFTYDLEEGDVIIMCTDGLTNMVNDKVIADVVGDGSDLELAGNTLISFANENGGRDNITVALIAPFER
ncbi:MAG: Stp1/IreP family PP2C-type Ser/Thr phosphatase [Lachnospiraceae bacterium]|nr:Stp1/IreP family PP2C-type Ser/Thr phosphatase [Lachnospiraceae bacterium]